MYGRQAGRDGFGYRRKVDTRAARRREGITRPASWVLASMMVMASSSNSEMGGRSRAGGW